MGKFFASIFLLGFDAGHSPVELRGTSEVLVVRSTDVCVFSCWTEYFCLASRVDSHRVNPFSSSGSGNEYSYVGIILRGMSIVGLLIERGLSASVPCS